MKYHFFIQWDSTNSCNLRCKHCYHNWFSRDTNILNNNEFKDMAKDLKSFTKKWDFDPFMHFSGGEPLLRKDLFDLIEYCNTLGIKTRILTNGTLITEEKAKELKKLGVVGIQISIDGNKETHNKIRGREYAFEKAIEGIRYCSNKGLTVNISTTLMQSNKEQLEDMIIETYEAGAKKIGFQSLVPSSKNDPEYINNKEIFEIYKKLDLLSEKYKNKITILKTEVLWNIYTPVGFLKQKSVELKKFGGGCGAGFVGLSVLGDGTVYPCRRLPINIGNIKDGIENIYFNSEVMQNLRDFNEYKGCNSCERITYCRGCRAIAYALTGDYMKKDPMCFNELLKNENKIYIKNKT